MDGIKKPVMKKSTITESAFFFWWSGDIHMENLGRIMNDKSYMKMSCIANFCLKSLRQARVICVFLKYSRRQRNLLIPPQPSTQFMSVGGFTHNQSSPVIPLWGWGRPFLLFQEGDRNCCVLSSQWSLGVEEDDIEPPEAKLAFKFVSILVPSI